MKKKIKQFEKLKQEIFEGFTEKHDLHEPFVCGDLLHFGDCGYCFCVEDIILLEKNNTSYDKIREWWDFCFEKDFEPGINLKNWLKYGDITKK